MRDPQTTSRIMAAVKGTGTGPELALRRELHRRGLRYRVATKLTGKPDLVFLRARVAVFVDGDRWHGNGWRVRGLSSFDDEFRHANSQFWRDKITRNMNRDEQVNRLLIADGWFVYRVWASELMRDLGSVADRVEGLVRERAKQGPPCQH